MARTRTSPRFQTALIGAFALVAMLLAASAAACLAPARRATSVDPATVLKSE